MRALKDMIVDSSNEATQYIVDVITHTTGGYEPPAKEMEEWRVQAKRRESLLLSLGYTNINVNQKTFARMPMAARKFRVDRTARIVTS